MTAASPAVPRTVLGRTGLTVSRLSVGTWGWGARTPVPPQVRVSDRAQLRDTLAAALAAGVNFIQTAAGYDNEDLIADLLAELGAGDDVVVATKFGHGLSFTAEGVRRSAESSLERLRIDRLPLFFLHDPRTPEDIEGIRSPGGALEALRALQDEGLVGALGVATGSVTALEAAVDSDLFDCIQFPRLYTLLAHTDRVLALLARARERGIGVINAAPLGGQILAAGSATGTYGFFPPIPEVRAAVERMEAECAVDGVPLVEAAYAWSYTEPLIDVTVPGLVTPAEVEAAVAAFGSALTRERLEEIAAAGAIDDALVGGPAFDSAWPAGRGPSQADFEAVFGKRASDAD